MRKALPVALGMLATPMIALAQEQPPPADMVDNEIWANASEVSNQLDAPSDEPDADGTLPPAEEIERPKLDEGDP